MASQADTINEKRGALENEVINNIDKGQQLYDIYKGQVLDRVGGNKKNDEALSLGHLGSKSIVIINACIYIQKVLNKVSSMDRELVPVMKKTIHGMVYVQDEYEAYELGKKYGYGIVRKVDTEGKAIDDKLYFDYPGKKITSNTLEEFAYDIVRTSSSYKGMTTEQVLQAISNIKPVPVFPAQPNYRPMPELYGSKNYKDEDAD